MGTPSSASPRFATEDDLISWLRQRTADRGGRLIGDDAAILPPSEEWAVTMDTQIESVHFAPDLESEAIARRLLAVNLSDLAAMGAAPAFAFLSLSAPDEFDQRGFFEALTASCAEHDLALAGGDLTGNSRVVAVMTLMGRRPEGQRWLLRRTARPGEELWLGGTVGEAGIGLALLQRGAALDGETLRLPAGLVLSQEQSTAARRAIRRHLLPVPQLELGRWLGSQSAGSAIDVSDGLSADLYRLCRESGVGVEVGSEQLPFPDDSKRLAGALDLDWRQLALGGGEDYVLLFTLSAEIEPPRSFGCTRIGRVVARDIILHEDGESVPLPHVGWDHLAMDRK